MSVGSSKFSEPTEQNSLMIMMKPVIIIVVAIITKHECPVQIGVTVTL
jgi:hypothetical protein